MEPLGPTRGISGAPMPKGGSFLNHDPFRLTSVPYQVTTYLFPSRATFSPNGRYGKSSRSSAETSSLRFDVGRPDHLAPLLCFFADELAEVGGRARKRRRT